MSNINLIKNHHQEIKNFRLRLVTLAVILAILAAMLIVRLFYLQVMAHNFYRTLSDQNHLVLLPIEPNRGLIYDRNGILLAENLPVFSLDIIPKELKKFKAALPEIKKIISISEDELEQFYKTWTAQSHLQPIPLKLNLNLEEVAKFHLNKYRVPGLTITARLLRHYPLGAELVSAVGYVGRISNDDLNNFSMTEYSANNFIGKIGIEKFYETYLHGKIGYQQVEIDARGQIIRTLKRILPESGLNLQLTIDSKLQSIAKQAFGTESGAAVAIDPSTGEVLALVSNPSYDPNLFANGISTRAFSALQNSPNNPLYNRAIRGQFPPGSTIKPFIALQALDSGAIDKNFTVVDPGWFKLPNSAHLYRDWLHKGHGRVNVVTSIIVSCDTFFFTIAVIIGIDAIDTILEQFGFGKKTGIDLDEELKGNVPSPSWKLKKVGARWYTGDTVISGIGQGYMLTTPLQLVHAVAAIANRGTNFVPHLLKKVIAPNGNIRLVKPIAETPIALKNAEHWKTVIAGMRGVIESTNPWGTGRMRFGSDASYTVAAKTGTVQLYSHYIDETQSQEALKIAKRLRNHSWFIAFAPVDNPQIAVAVIAENSGIAGSIARNMLDYYFKKH